MGANKLSIKPFGTISKGSSTPEKGVKVKSKSSFVGLEGKYTTKKGTKFSGSVSKEFYSGNVNFPGGSESWKGSTKPYFEFKVEKKFNNGGIAKYYKDII